MQLCFLNKKYFLHKHGYKFTGVFYNQIFRFKNCYFLFSLRDRITEDKHEHVYGLDGMSLPVI